MNQLLKEKSYLKHRQRLKNKFNKSPSVLEDYELLEMTLFLVQKRKDTKLFAKELLKKFKTINDIIYASNNDLKMIYGIGDATCHIFCLIRELIKRVLKSKIIGKDVVTCWQDLMLYLQNNMGNMKKEEFHVLFLDIKNQIIADEAHSKGTIDKVTIYPREVIERALNLGAAAIILVHNHPTGDTEPSREDIELTRHIKEVCLKLGITLYDHIIVGKYQQRSMKALQLI